MTCDTPDILWISKQAIGLTIEDDYEGTGEKYHHDRTLKELEERHQTLTKEAARIAVERDKWKELAQNRIKILEAAARICGEAKEQVETLINETPTL